MMVGCAAVRRHRLYDEGWIEPMWEGAAALAVRRFTMDDQRDFALLSGDVNPLHVDELAARRAMFGEPVVHGVHTALWALEALVARRGGTVTGVTVRFPKPCFLDEPVEALAAAGGEHSTRLKVQVGDVSVADLRVEFGCGEAGSGIDARGPVELRVEPAVLALADLADREGILEIPVDSGALHARFPALCRSVGTPAVAQLVALSRLVGMECPGLDSLFSGFEVHATDGASDVLSWRVTRADERYSAVTMSVSGGRWEGSVMAFVRPRAVVQATATDLSGLPVDGEFSGMRALVVGGSRGLGELTAKLVAAGGGEVAVTWHRGEADADAVVADITAAGGSARPLQLDVGDPHRALDELAAAGFVATHLFFFATPRIFVRRTRRFDPALFAEFTDVYVTGFASTIDACRAAGSRELVAFYPSSSAVDEQLAELTEYAAAKAAGEVVARTLGGAEKWLEVVVERLPRLPTDQTATLAEVPAGDPIAAMLGVLRQVRGGFRGDPRAEGAAHD